MQDLFSWIPQGDPDGELARAIDPERLPRHIAVIMDGNGRWAHQRGLPRVAGHQAGVEGVRATVETCARLGLEALTLYAFSVENWKRPLAEVETLWKLLRLYLRQELRTLLKNNIQFRAVGRIDGLSPEVQAELRHAEEKTQPCTGMRLNLAINYGGRAELVDAVNALLQEARERGEIGNLRVDEEQLSRYLYTADTPDPDLLIRTSGEMRISNFLLWQIAYSELYVTETLWPDFRRSDLLRAVLCYQGRDRRFGAVSESYARSVMAGEWAELVSVPSR